MNGKTVKKAEYRLAAFNIWKNVLKVSGTAMFEKPILGARFDTVLFFVFGKNIIKLA